MVSSCTSKTSVWDSLSDWGTGPDRKQFSWGLEQTPIPSPENWSSWWDVLVTEPETSCMQSLGSATLPAHRTALHRYEIQLSQSNTTDSFHLVCHRLERFPIEVHYMLISQVTLSDVHICVWNWLPFSAMSFSPSPSWQHDMLQSIHFNPL